MARRRGFLVNGGERGGLRFKAILLGIKGAMFFKSHKMDPETPFYRQPGYKTFCDEARRCNFQSRPDAQFI